VILEEVIGNYSRRKSGLEASLLEMLGETWQSIAMKREQERASRAEYFGGWLRDLKYAVRILRKAKASSATAILILAAGVGANTAVFTFLDRLLYRPLPVPKPSPLVLISNSSLATDGSGNRSSYIFSYEEYAYLRDRSQTFSGLAAEALVLALTGIAASIAPAWRAAHLDPVEALRVQ
jgi:hypothetical protein